MTLDTVALSHLCMGEFCTADGPHDMKSLYKHLGVYPTSPNGDAILIRSHIAYHFGHAEAERAVIKPSRGHSYRVSGMRWKCGDTVVRITDYFDHRGGVSGLT